MYYEVHGEGPWLAFAHGAGGNHLSWWQQVPYFMRWFECVTVDQRGFGLSPDPELYRAIVEDLSGWKYEQLWGKGKQ